jgi:hypothetical protein
VHVQPLEAVRDKHTKEVVVETTPLVSEYFLQVVSWLPPFLALLDVLDDRCSVVEPTLKFVKV